MSESAPRNPFRSGQAAGAAEPEITGASMLSDAQREDVQALRASRRAQQAAVAAGPIHISPEPPRAPIRAIASRAVHRAQEGLAGLKQSAQSRWGSLREPEPGQEELDVLDVTVPSTQPETEDIPSIETSDELLGRLLTELEVLKDQYYEKLSPRQAAIELARKLGLGGNTDEERIAKIRAAYSQALDHASEEAFERFEKGLQNKRLDRLWVPTEEFLRKESQQEQAATPAHASEPPAASAEAAAPTPPAEESESAQEAEAAQPPTPPPFTETTPVETEQAPSEWEPSEAEATAFLLGIPEMVREMNKLVLQLRNYRSTQVTRDDVIYHVARKMGIRYEDVRVMIYEFFKRYTKATNVAVPAYYDMREELWQNELFPVWLDWISPHAKYRGRDIPGAEVYEEVYETADIDHRWAPWREGMGEEPALAKAVAERADSREATEPAAVAATPAASAAAPRDIAQPAIEPPRPPIPAWMSSAQHDVAPDFLELGQAVPRVREIGSERALSPDPYPERFTDEPQEASEPDELSAIMPEAHELIPLLKDAGLADKTPQELAVIARKLHRDLEAHIVDRMYEREQKLIPALEQELRQRLHPEIEAQLRQERSEEDEAVERMNQWVDLMIEFPRRYPEDFPDPNNLNTDAFFKRLVELQERAGVDSDDMIRNEDDLLGAMDKNVKMMRTEFAKAFLVSFHRSGFDWIIPEEERQET